MASDERATECPSPKRRKIGPETLTVRDFEMHVTNSQLRIFSFDYYILGLVEESGEVIEASKKKVAATVRCDVASELGDVLWYTTALRLSLEDEPMTSWPLASETEADSQRAAGDCPTATGQLLTIASKLAGKAKRAIRGDHDLLVYLPDLRKLAREMLTCCAEVAGKHGLSLEQCAQKNIQKIEGRRSRGSMLGDGSNR
jgi:NTP pyrophosphatase (non-canonical NTP hydrolase)